MVSAGSHNASPLTKRRIDGAHDWEDPEGGGNENDFDEYSDEPEEGKGGGEGKEGEGEAAPREKTPSEIEADAQLEELNIYTSRA